jgi:hypothetical protein
LETGSFKMLYSVGASPVLAAEFEDGQSMKQSHFLN